MKVTVCLVALVAALCVLGGVSMAQDVSNCGKDTDDILITSISMSPDPPVRGQNLTLALSGTVQTAVSGGKVNLEVYMSGIKIFTHDWDLCTTFGQWVNCPLQPGSFDRTVSEVFPTFVPPGHFTGKIYVVDTDGKPVACAAFDIKEVPNPSRPSLSLEELDAPVLRDDLIAEVNRHGEWKAHRSPRFEGVTRRQLRKMLGTVLTPNMPADIPTVVLRGENVPDSFDSRQKWPHCIHPIRNQEQCGSCWAFGAAEALSDRFCIAGKDVVLSPQYLVSCDTASYGCQGGFLPSTWKYFANHGVPTDKCVPYTSGGGHAPKCPGNTCHDGSKAEFYKVKAGSIVQPKDVTSIQNLIYSSGPVEAAFSVYQDFMSYHSGVYRHKTGGLEGGHAIKIVGWGNDNGTPYWIVANSWGPSWGLKGYFWILRGHNECGIESNVIGGTPDV